METYDDDDTFDEADFYGSATPTSGVTDTEVTDEAPADGGQGDVTDSAPDEGAPPQTDYFDPSAFANHKVKVKVDGEELEVPVPELVQGYQRQADYTRKTQALAEERQQVAFWQQVDQAMRVNPAGTLEYLQRTYGISPQQAAAGVDSVQGEDWQDDDPIRKELAELKQTIGSVSQFMAQQQAERELRQTVEGLTAKYGDDFNPTEVISEALRRGIDNPAQLELVYQSMAFDRIRAQAAAAQQFQTNAAQTDAQRQAAAAAASQIVSGGTGATGKGAPPAKASTPSNISVRDAIALALAEAGA